MKAKITFEDGKNEIVLTPENEFEKDLIGKIVDNKEIRFDTKFNYDGMYGTHKNHEIKININTIK